MNNAKKMISMGSDYSKQFLPDEIAWLREVVEQCNQSRAEQPAA
jgi:peptidyl-prolyl cis-trans isomerase C